MTAFVICVGSSLLSKTEDVTIVYLNTRKQTTLPPLAHYHLLYSN